MKPGAFTQLYVHIIFAVKYRSRILTKEIRPTIYTYMSGIIAARKNKAIIINGVSDHIHILVGLNPNEKVSDIVANLKRSTTLYINENKLVRGLFKWQDGYGAFSYSKSQLDKVYKYISNQERHHKRKTFKEEYVELLDRFEVKYDRKYLFDFFE